MTARKPPGRTKAKPGRKPGSKNKATIEREITKIARAQSVGEVIAAGVTPLEVLLRAMRGQPLPDGSEITERMIVCADKAAPYIHPKLANVTVKDETPPPPPVFDLSGLTADECASLLKLFSKAKAIPA